MASSSPPTPLLSTTILSFLLLYFLLSCVSTVSEASQIQSRRSLISYRRNLLGSSSSSSSAEEDDYTSSSLPPPSKKKATTTSTTTSTKIGVTVTANTKTNQTKLLKPKKTNSTTAATLTSSSTPKIGVTKTLNSTTKSLKLSNSTKLLKPSNSTKILKPIKPVKLNTTTTTTTKPKTNLKFQNSTSISTNKPTTPTLTKSKTTQQKKPQQQQTKKSVVKPVPIMPWLDDTETDDADLISEFRDLPSKFQQTLLPDLEKMSTKSKAYLTLANKEFTKTFKPIVGTKYAPSIATATSATFLLLPLALVTILFHHLRHYLSLQKILLSIQIYLAIYFSTLSLTSLLTGLEPLKFFYATSPGSYVYTQVLQTLGYVLYLLLQLMNLIVVFSTGFELGSRMLGLAQVIVGLAVGLHYYAAVFHRAVLGEPPKTNWKIHTVYAASFLVICLFARAERRKKAYLGEGGVDDGKKS